ncbi:MAG: hypothetical protein PHS60_16800, partial [Zavarzinia sp.]|nr:hypothetical protein [Zavarzinia sp.]
EFIAQTLLLGAAHDIAGPLPTATDTMLALLGRIGLLSAEQMALLRRASALQSGLSAVLRLTAGDAVDPHGASAQLRALLARHAGVVDFAALEATLDEIHPAVRACFTALVGDPATAYVPNSGAGTGGLQPLEE